MNTNNEEHFWDTVWRWLKIFYKHPFGQISVAGILLGIGFYFGYVIRNIFPNNIILGLIAIATAIAGCLAALLKLTKTVFDLEIKDKELKKLLEKSTQLEPNKIGDEILNYIESHSRLFDPHMEGRSKHWKREKQFLAKKIVDFLGKKIRSIQKNNKNIKIAIIFDAGSTISPILDELGMCATKDTNHWARGQDISFITNNLSGVSMLLSYNDPNEKDDRHASLPFACKVLPGEVLSAYAATASEDTIKQIEDLRKDYNFIIAVTTGNYLFLDIHKRHVVAIARTGKHPNIKTALSNIADEIYYVAPLGEVVWVKLGTLFKVFNLLCV